MIHQGSLQQALDSGVVPDSPIEAAPGKGDHVSRPLKPLDITSIRGGGLFGAERCLSNKAFKVLRAMVESAGVWSCPVQTPKGVYHALRIPAIDVLAPDSEFVRHHSGQIMGVSKLELVESAVTDIFRLALPAGSEGGSRVYVTDDLLTKALDAGLKGFSGVRVWQSK